MPELGFRVIILAGRRGHSRFHKGVFPGGGMLRLRQWQLLAVALLVCFAPLGCGSSGHPAPGSAVGGGPATTGGKSTFGGQATTGAGGASGSNGSTAPASTAPPTATGTAAPASTAPSTLKSYNPGSVSQTAKPPPPDNGVVSLGNIGSPTIDSTHPNGSTGHLIPAGSSPHCILVYNFSLPLALTIVSVSFQVGIPGSGAAGPLQFVADNTDQNCGWLSGGYAAPASLRSPTCAGKTLPAMPMRPTGPPFTYPGCVLRVDIPSPTINVDRTGHFTFVFQTQCVDRSVAPCSRLAVQPTAAHPVTVRWSPGPFYVVFCGKDFESDVFAAAGVCVHPSPSPSASPSP